MAYSGGREAHVCPYGRVELIRSRDDGRTWTFPEVVLDTPIDDRDAGIVETPSGALLVTTFTSLAYEACRSPKNPSWLSRPGPHHARAAQAAPRLLDAPLHRRRPHLVRAAPRPVNSPHGPVALGDGRLLYAGKQLWQPGAKVGVCDSSDDGRTWRWLSDIPARPGHDPAQYHELHAVDAGRGRLLVHIRNHNPLESRRDPPNRIHRWRQDMDHPPPHRRLGTPLAPSPPSRRSSLDDLRLPPRALR